MFIELGSPERCLPLGRMFCTTVQSHPPCRSIHKRTVAGEHRTFRQQTDLNSDLVVLESKELLSEHIEMFLLPFFLQELLDLLSASEKSASVTPNSVGSVSKGDFGWGLGIPKILSCLDFFNGCLVGERRTDGHGGSLKFTEWRRRYL